MDSPHSAVSLASVPTTRLPTETSKAYAAFRTYAEMGAQRSLTAVAQELGKSATIIERWSSRHQWQERIKTWDDEQARIAQEAAATSALENARKYEARREELRERLWAIQEEMADKLIEMLEFPLAKDVVEGADGNTTVTKPLKWSYGDAVRLAQAVQSIGAFSTGLENKPANSNTDKPDANAPLPKMVIEVVHQQAATTKSAEEDGQNAAQSGNFVFTRS